MQCQGLSEDNIWSIFSFCDITTVLSVGMANKYLHRLSLNKLVWVNLVDNLRYRGFIDLLSPSDIRSKSQEELVALVKALLTGPTSWIAPVLPLTKPKLPFLARFRSKPTSQARQARGQAEISMRYSLHLPAPRSFAEGQVKLLPGGKYILIANSPGTLECWSVQREKLIWAYEKATADIIGFSAQVLDGGDEANIIVCEKWSLHDAKNLVRILNLNFHTGISTTFFTNSYESSYIIQPKICGKFACLVYPSGVLSGCYPCVLIDWQSKLHTVQICTEATAQGVLRSVASLLW
ncbi:F-box domain-containing protein [Mycena venus]|uniref:F-box domain-containing protein n=1 Tax=Mycena venus TaxID=2733690 RepID=A0A8H6TZV9_9AGAR|nr:F-box domain-containing protein [Mycena venus]